MRCSGSTGRPLQEYRQELLKRYEIVDMGHKVVGVGSVGLLAAACCCCAAATRMT